MNADKYGFGMGVGDRDAGGERNKRIIPPGQNGFEAGFLKCLVQAQGDIESDALFGYDILRDAAKVAPAMSGINDHGGKYAGSECLFYRRDILLGFMPGARMLRFGLRGKNGKQQDE